MEEFNWEDCIEHNKTIKVSVPKFKIKSLIITANGRIEFIKSNNPNQDNASYIFESYYTSLLELLHALALSYGCQISNHVCIGFFLRDLLKREDLFREFDDFRYKRNSLAYYGKSMDFTIAKEAIKRIIKMISEIQGMLK